ncbi:hypothetical protein CCM_07378 [Cordyceps militaris CM01]|uniref:Glyoxalase-like domain-containing protein n=1 Tax=Cordyceps militaris (strain CM01) TaxID=983644 RepID=G3JQV0_CORMM|nr:uncharacterized protein CCM_07378 [Cordyceps militaris CM01]EGX89126.1 hypothetical protein CCM_07378 [Cordyceps militaris CM01]
MGSLWIDHIRPTISTTIFPFSKHPPVAMSTALHTIDHIYLRVHNAGVVHQELVEKAGLPVAWPFCSVADGLASGAVSLGNLILELVQVDTACTALPFIPTYGVALAPGSTLEDSRAWAAARDIEMDADDSFYGSGDQLLWTRAALPQLSGDTLDTFFCHYTADQWPLRAGAGEQLARSEGGPLGITGVEALIVTSARCRLPQTAETWSRMAMDRGDRGGPAVRVVAGEDEGLQGLTIRVRDVEAAERKFKELLPHFPDSLRWQFI